MDVLNPDFLEAGAFITDPATGSVLLGLGGEVSEVSDFATDGAFYLKDFYRNNFLKYVPKTWVKLSREELLAKVRSFPDLKARRLRNFDDTYVRDFDALKLAFGEDLKKVVLVSREEYDLPEAPNPLPSLIKKALTFGAGLPYGLWFKGEGVIGSTPEVLFDIRGEELYTFALAGTGKKGEEESLLSSSKDRLEHDLVVDDIKEKLAPFCRSIENLPTGLTAFKHLIHLETDIKGRLLPGVSLRELATSLSPTAALGGYPKERALAFLTETEYHSRHPERKFGSAFGVVSKELELFVVSIRNVQWKNNIYFIESGGGVLSESVCEKELAEIALKRNAIREHYL